MSIFDVLWKTVFLKKKIENQTKDLSIPDRSSKEHSQEYIEAFDKQFREYTNSLTKGKKISESDLNNPWFK